MSLNRRSIHLWIPNIFFFKGGIQVYSAFFLQALNSFSQNTDYHIFLKHDRSQSPDFAFSDHNKFHFAGNWHLPWRTLAFASQILGHGLWQRPKLIIATHLNFTVAAYWLKRLTRISYWAVAHGVDAWNIQRPALKTALHHADRILAVSGYTRDRLIKEQHLDPAKIAILPNTFDSDRFQIAPKPKHLLERYQLTANHPVILTVARLDMTERNKGYDQILLALPEIRRHLPNIRYIIVGKGSDRPRIEQLIDQLDLQDLVILAGFVPDEELSAYYHLCDVFAMPSQNEGFGIVYLEALACGKPTLGGNRDGAIDALCGGELGVLVNPEDVSAIAQTLIAILQGEYPHPLLYQPELLRQKVIDIYGFEQFKTTLQELIQTIDI